MNINKAKISNYQIKKIIKCFTLDIVASKTALLLSINRNETKRLFTQTVGEDMMDWWMSDTISITVSITEQTSFQKEKVFM
jgi:hypothetical protein